MNIRVVGVWTFLIYLSRFTDGRTCQRREWKYFPEEKMYYKDFAVPKSFDDAQSICESFSRSGHLITIPNSTTLLSIQRWMKEKAAKLPKSGTHCLKQFHIGLRTKPGEENSADRLQWVDRRFLHKDLKAFLGDNTNTKDVACYSTKWCDPGKYWIAGDCLQKRPFICESDDPCTAGIRMTKDKGQPLADHDSVSMGEGNLTLTCHGTGYIEALVDVSMYCEWDPQRLTVNGESKVSLTVPVTPESDNKECVCTSKVSKGSPQRISIRLSFFKSVKFAAKSSAHSKDAAIYLTGGFCAIFIVVAVFTLYRASQEIIGRQIVIGSQGGGDDDDTERKCFDIC